MSSHEHIYQFLPADDANLLPAPNVAVDAAQDEIEPRPVARLVTLEADSTSLRPLGRGIC